MPELSPDGMEFVTARGLASLTTLRGDGTPHVTPVGYTWDDAAGLVRVICGGGSQKVVNARRRPRVAVCQADGPRWLTFEGTAEVSDDPARVAEAVERYARRYREPRVNPRRVVIEIAVDRVLGSEALRRH